VLTVYLHRFEPIIGACGTLFPQAIHSPARIADAVLLAS
jgi:hypothetical protein